MKLTNQILVIVLAFIFASCKDSGTNQQITTPQRSLTISASANNVAAPVDISFTGTLHTYTETMRMYVPDAFIMGCPTLTVVRNRLPDTTVAAKQSYGFVRNFPVAGSYSVYIVLQTLQGDIFSDTLAITIH